MPTPKPVAKAKPIETKHLMGSLFPPPPIDDYPEHMRKQVAVLRVKLRRRRAISLVLSVISYLAMASAAVVTALTLALATDRASPVKVAVVILTPQVIPGHQLRMQVLIDRKRMCRSRITFRIFDGDATLKTLVETPWSDAAGPTGIDIPFVRTLTLPVDAAPGVGRLRIERSYQCPMNPFHKVWPITEVEPDKTFDIEAKP